MVGGELELIHQQPVLCKNRFRTHNSHMQEQHVSLLVFPDKVHANISSIYLLIQGCRIHVYRWGTDWEDSDHEWWLANGIYRLTWAPRHCRPAMVLFTFPKFLHGREVFSLQMDWTRNCEIRTSQKKHPFLKPWPPDPLLKTSWQLILINERRYTKNKWLSCIFLPIYIHWKILELSILMLLTPGFEPKSSPSY